MTLLDEIIKIQIVRNDVSITRVGFGTALIVGNTNSNFPGIIKDYVNLAEVGLDFAANSTEYLMATKLFGQQFKPDRILITQQLAQTSLLNAYLVAQNIDPDFYAVLLTSTIESDVLAFAAQIETENRIFATSTQDPNVLNNDPDNILEKLKELNYDHTFMFVHSAANTVRPEAALLGRMLPTVAGSETWAYKTLTGVPSDNLLYADERANIRENFGIFYANLAGVNVTQEGSMVNGEFIDTIHGLHWLEQYIKENIAALLIASGKIPYNNQGIGLVENALRASLQEAVNRGIINEDYVVTTPDVTTISLINKADRVLPDVTFDATLTGAIHKINQITGTVTV